jgi:hypothetical protein
MFIINKIIYIKVEAAGKEFGNFSAGET